MKWRIVALTVVLGATYRRIMHRRYEVPAWDYWLE